MFNLEGRTVFVTGSSQGVGRAIALSAAKAQANVVLHGLQKDELAERTIRDCQQFGVEVTFVSGDLCASSQQIAEFATMVSSQVPNIDLLVNNAGSYFDRPFLEMPAHTFERTMRLNVVSYFVLTQHFARRWVEQSVDGRVLLVGSINGRLAERTHVAYDTSKGAIEMMVKSMCVELAPHDIRVNGLAPGLFRTPLTASALDGDGETAWMELHTPNGCVPGPEVAGGPAVFLLSDAAEHIHGHMLMVDGGMSAWQQPERPADFGLNGSEA